MTEIKKFAVDDIPSDLDPDRSPIIAEHFFGWRRLGDVTAGIIRDLRRRRNIDRLCHEWPRAIVELIDDIGAIVVATLANVIARLHYVSQAHARVLAEHLLAVEHQDRTRP